MHIRFWGVRGSIPVSGPGYVRTGGNTTSVEFESEGQRLVIDGGTGLRALGDALGPDPVALTLLFTHTHWDHIQGVPFFSPFYNPASQVTLAGPRSSAGDLRSVLSAQMRPPTFPITLNDMRAELRFQDVEAGTPFEVGPFRVTACALCHPDGVFAYRISAAGRTVVFATDLEHGGVVDDRLVRFARGADLLIHDAQYTPEEYRGEGGPSRRGWGHATWCEAVEAAERAEVGRLALFHHDPRRLDEGVDALEALALARFPATFAAREGVPVTI